MVESAAIEGQKIPPERVATSAHMQAYQSMIVLADGGAELRLDDVKNWQRLIGGEQQLWGDRSLPVDDLGQYRKHNIGLGMPDGSFKSIGASWEKVADEMGELWDLLWIRGDGDIGWTGLRQWLDRTPLEKAAIIHHRFERIHPFADGNGRSGRLLALYVLRWAKVAPVLFTNWDKAQAYYPCFPEKAPDKMIEYFKAHQAEWD